MKAKAAVLAMLLVAGCAHEAEVEPGPIYSYVRSNRDGSEAETIHVYRPRADYVEVTKMRDRCTNAAFVTATTDPATGQAVRLTGGRLRPGATHEDFADLTYRDRRIDARLTTPQGELRQSVEAADAPLHLYDFDWASLSAAPPAALRDRGDFSFGVALIWLGDDPAEFLRYLGRADARFVREERRDGRRALRYELGGPAFAGPLGGALWLDAHDGFVVGADLGRPNHAEYRDFRLRLTGIDRGRAAWKRLLEAHFDGCP